MTAAAVWGTMKYRWELEEFDQNPEAGIKAVVLILKLLRRTYIDYRAEIFGIVGGYMQRLNRSLSLEHVGEIEQKHLQPGEEPVVHELIEFDAKKARKKGHEQGHKQGHKQGLEQGVKQGVVKGREEALQEVAIALLHDMTPKTVAARTKLPLAQVLKLKKQNGRRNKA